MVVAEFVQANSKNAVLACTAEVDHERGGDEKGVVALSTLKCK